MDEQQPSPRRGRLGGAGVRGDGWILLRHLRIAVVTLVSMYVNSVTTVNPAAESALEPRYQTDPDRPRRPGRDVGVAVCGEVVLLVE